MIITIDGPAGTGKSTVAAKVAARLDFLKLDTGALYRAIAAGCLLFDIDPTDWNQLERFLHEHKLTVHLEALPPTYLIDQTEVSNLLRSHEVNNIVSPVATCPAVREALLPIQREIAQRQNIVSEGRDMGTTVFPQANTKFFLTATPEVRAARRYLEMKEKGLISKDMTVETIRAQIEMRDSIDSSRLASPLKKAFDAIEIDTSCLSIDEVVETILQHIK